MPAVQVHQTTDYSLFARHPLSRSISQSNLSALKESLSEKSMLDTQHIEVVKNNGKYPDIKEPFLITNGNHRYLAAKDLGLTIHYIFDEDFEDKDMARQFNASAKWSLQQILSYYCKLQNSEYLRFKKFVEDMGIDLKTCLQLVRKPTNRAHNRRSFMKGSWTFPNEVDLREKMNKAIEFLNLGQERAHFKKSLHCRVQFFDAFFKMLDLKEFDWNHFMKKHNDSGCVLGRHMLSSGYYVQLINFHGKKLEKVLGQTKSDISHI